MYLANLRQFPAKASPTGETLGARLWVLGRDVKSLLPRISLLTPFPLYLANFTPANFTLANFTSSIAKTLNTAKLIIKYLMIIKVINMRSEQATKMAQKLGDLIRQHRTLHYTQSTFAKMIGVSRSTVQKLEQGDVVKSDILFEALVVLNLQGSLLDEINELAADVGGYNARQRKRNSPQEINDDF